MIPPERTVALVGRPNVGKSRLFNRLVGRRVAIVHDQPGVTRDLASAEVEESFILLDTGGIGIQPEMTPQMIHQATEEQVNLAIQAASLILLVVDGSEAVNAVDLDLAARLRSTGKQVIVVVNKVDRQPAGKNLDSFYSLGLGDPMPVSAEHGLGAQELFDRIMKTLGPMPPGTENSKPSAERIPICLCGRPNVGKSSLANRLLKAPRLIVSELAGTTRDAIEIDLDYTDKDGEVVRFRLIDTAGVKPRRKLGSSLDYFSGLRTSEAITRTQVCFLILDAVSGVTKHDKTLAGEILKAGPGLVIVVNKWDLALQSLKQQDIPGYQNEADFRTAFAEAVRKELFFLPDSPMLFVSALSGFQVESLIQTARAVHATAGMTIPTGALNSAIRELTTATPPRVVSGRRFKIYYATQTAKHPLTFKLFCNQRERLDERYQRYLDNGLRERFRLQGCPIRLELVGKPRENPYYQALDPGKDRRAVNTLAKHRRRPRQPDR